MARWVSIPLIDYHIMSHASSQQIQLLSVRLWGIGILSYKHTPSSDVRADVSHTVTGAAKTKSVLLQKNQDTRNQLNQISYLEFFQDEFTKYFKDLPLSNFCVYIIYNTIQWLMNAAPESCSIGILYNSDSKEIFGYLNLTGVQNNDYQKQSDMVGDDNSEGVFGLYYP